MIADISTVVWKEWKELLIRRGSMRGGAMSLLILVGLLSVIPPLQVGRAWVQSPIAVIIAAWIPLFFVMGNICDAFAGERERHTLATLLASPLSDKAILFGKIAAAVSYGWALTLAAHAMSLLITNVAFWEGHILLYTPSIAAGILAFGLLSAVLAAGAGILASIRAETVRQARQRVSLAFMLLTIPALGMQALPLEWRTRLADMPPALDPGKIVIILAVILLAIDVGLLALAYRRFKRAQLIMD